MKKATFEEGGVEDVEDGAPLKKATSNTLKKATSKTLKKARRRRRAVEEGATLTKRPIAP